MSDPRFAKDFAINLHIALHCDMRCRYCHSRFRGMNEISTTDWTRIISVIDDATRDRCPNRKITFAGGEPTNREDLGGLIGVAKEKGFFTSLITNGFRLAHAKLDESLSQLDEIGISIDSVDPFKNAAIGRSDTDGRVTDYRAACYFVRAKSIRLKINTVVSRANVDDDMSAFITAVQPDRWKILQVRCIDGDNAAAARDLVSVEEFNRFVSRNTAALPKMIILSPESASAQAGSYVMASPDGRLFDSASETYQFSERILDVGFEAAFNQVSFRPDMFEARGGGHFRKWEANGSR